MKNLYTIGYGNRTIESILEAVGDRLVVDVRSRPYSGRKEFCRQALAERLGEQYLSLPELGGFEATGDPAGRNRALEKVRAVLEEKEIVLLCAEMDPERCHRKPLAEEILAGNGETAIHLLAAKADDRQKKLF
jgi:uncharacterized protein (DUF488 family)